MIKERIYNDAEEKMMHLAMCDDDLKSLEMLKKMIFEIYPGQEGLQISEYTNGEQLLLQFQPGKYDVIILDIEMNGINGLEAAEKIRNMDKKVILVFLTSHQEFAASGYEVNAFRYLLKQQPQPVYQRQLQAIFREYHQTHLSLPVSVSDTIYNICINDILYFEIFKRKLIIHTIKNQYQIIGKLSDFEKDGRLLDFIKPHRSYYLNLAYIDRIESADLFMKNGDRIPLSRNLKKNVTEQFISYLSSRC